tara:strand:+ start:1721 stop:2533 length:813 start_codon:yes stop_codon:yes gene_type:complete
MTTERDYQKASSFDSELPIEETTVPVYQRERLSRKTIQAIKADFHWDMFGRPLVSQLKNGEYEVIDGQHRIIALEEMWGKELVIPVHVTKRKNLADRAGVFVDTNGNRKAVNAHEIFKAEVYAERAEAVGIKKIADRMNVTLGYRTKKSRPNRCGSINQLRQLYRYNNDVLERTLGILSEAWPEDSQRFEAVNLAGVGLFLNTFPNADGVRLVERLSKHPASVISGEVAVIRGYTASTNTIKNPAALVVTKEYNKGLGAKSRVDELRFMS